jgi:hypothetical protein
MCLISDKLSMKCIKNVPSVVFRNVLAIQLQLIFRKSASLDFSALVGEPEELGFKLGAG